MTQCSCVSVKSNDNNIDNPEEDIFQLIEPRRLDLQTDHLVRLDDNNIAEISFNGDWLPICGHWFWDNGNGADLFCQELGYQSGQLGDRTQLPREGIRIGRCNNGDTWPNCSSGCNDQSIGGTQCSDCRSGALAGIKINCDGKGFTKDGIF